jgi:Domain of unknown function (DU1801)
MSDNKTKPNSASVTEFLNSVADEQKRKDCKAISKLMKEVTGTPAKMWGDSMVGFGSYHYKYDSGREGDFFLTGFSPRKQNLTIYIMAGFERYPKLVKKLGKCKTSKSCLYIKRLEDLDLDVLRELVKVSSEDIARRYK